MTIKEVFEKYKHLDAALSDSVQIEGQDSFLKQIARDLWQAIKESMSNGKHDAP